MVLTCIMCGATPIMHSLHAKSLGVQDKFIQHFLQTWRGWGTYPTEGGWVYLTRAGVSFNIKWTLCLVLHFNQKFHSQRDLNPRPPAIAGEYSCHWGTWVIISLRNENSDTYVEFLGRTIATSVVKRYSFNLTIVLTFPLHPSATPQARTARP